jgi:hypothetical protein
MPASFLDDYLSEDELLELLRGKLKLGSKRWLRKQRQLRQGPPWAKIGDAFLYHKGGAAAWVASLIQQPVRQSRRSAA